VILKLFICSKIL